MPLMMTNQYRHAYAQWPPIFGQQFGYKQVICTDKEGDEVTVPLTGLHKDGWWIGVRICAATDKGPLNDVEFTCRIGDKEWTQTAGEWCQIDPVPWTDSDAVMSVILSEPLYSAITYSVRPCFYYTK
jgi:hypothetical protein